MNDYPKPPFDTKITITEDPSIGSGLEPTVTILDLDDLDNEDLEIAAASGSELAIKILAFRVTNQDQKD
jgi:hypothetical protein